MLSPGNFLLLIKYPAAFKQIEYSHVATGFLFNINDSGRERISRRRRGTRRPSENIPSIFLSILPQQTRDLLLSIGYESLTYNNPLNKCRNSPWTLFGVMIPSRRIHLGRIQLGVVPVTPTSRQSDAIMMGNWLSFRSTAFPFVSSLTPMHTDLAADIEPPPEDLISETGIQSAVSISGEIGELNEWNDDDYDCSDSIHGEEVSCLSPSTDPLHPHRLLSGSTESLWCKWAGLLSSDCPNWIREEVVEMPWLIFPLNGGGGAKEREKLRRRKDAAPEGPLDVLKRESSAQVELENLGDHLKIWRQWILIKFVHCRHTLLLSLIGLLLP